MTRRRRAVVGLALTLTLLPACSDDGDRAAFCDRLADTEQVGDVLGDLDTSDPAGVEDRLQEAVGRFRDLESDAPGEIRDDVARIRQGVELVLEAVQDNPDDLPAAREAIAGQADELSGLAQAAEAVTTYAATECDLDLTDEEPVTTGGPTTTGG